ncbi:MAG: hypothetical protein ABR573_12005 [Candidatus Dormibacteria bacterium]
MAKLFRARVLASSNVEGRGTVAIVEVQSGRIDIGARVVVGDVGLTAAVTAVEVFAQDEEDRAEGALPQVGLLLTGVDRGDLPKGCPVTKEGTDDA